MREMVMTFNNFAFRFRKSFGLRGCMENQSILQARDTRGPQLIQILMVGWAINQICDEVRY